MQQFVYISLIFYFPFEKKRSKFNYRPSVSLVAFCSILTSHHTPSLPLVGMVENSK